MQQQMYEFSPNRRSILTLGGALAGSLLGRKSLKAEASPDSCDHDADDEPTAGQQSVAEQIQEIIGAEGMFSDGVFSIEIDREDLDNVTLHGVPILPSFEINGTLYFQFQCDGRVMMNSDIALKPSEIDPFIDALIANDIVFQAEHQHLYDFNPIVWFIHFRKLGNPLEIAHGVKAALNKTSTPFPQTSPANPTTPLPANAIGDILGAKPQISSNGVVNYDIPRKNRLRLGGVIINPYLNVSTPVAFQPLDSAGQKAAAIPDFGMVHDEIMPVMRVMRTQGWDIGCLYNQETDEHPQLYFSHQFKTGDPIELAKEIRKGLDQMELQFES